MNEQVYNAQVASEGIAVGPLVHWIDTLVCNRKAGDVTHERAVFVTSLTTARSEVSELLENLDELASEIMEFQLAMLEDEDFYQPAEVAIDHGIPADVAWQQLCDAEIRNYAESGSEYLAARVDDLRDIRDRVLRAFCGDKVDMGELPEGGIVFAQDLTPSSFLAFDWDRLGGAVIRGGSPTSHVAILARARGVALLVGVTAPSLRDMNGCKAVLDSTGARLVLTPSDATCATLAQAKRDLSTLNGEADAMRAYPAVTASGEAVKVLINIDNLEALADIDVAECDGIGLFRTEFLIEGASLPDEDTQLARYTKVLDWAKGKPVTIRTFDAGGDKPVAGFTHDGETNPFLGVRGVRLSLTLPKIFKTQLRALVRANVDGNLKIMVPMITTPAEMTQVRMLFNEVCDELMPKHRPALGMMIEVPAAALMAADFDADFFSIGSNDLVQYTMAAARDNAAVAYLADASSPAVRALIEMTINAGRDIGIEVSLCGDMASNENHTKTLLESGLRVFSVSNALLGRVKLAISTINLSGGDRG